MRFYRPFRCLFCRRSFHIFSQFQCHVAKHTIKYAHINATNKWIKSEGPGDQSVIRKVDGARIRHNGKEPKLNQRCSGIETKHTDSKEPKKSNQACTRSFNMKLRKRSRKEDVQCKCEIYQKSALVCQFCYMNFTTKRGLTAHIGKSHQAEAASGLEALATRPKCEVCQKRFRCNSALKTHVINIHEPHWKTEVSKHKKNKAKHLHQCHYCGKFFPKMSKLIRHIRTHTKEKPYQCQYCHKSFALSSTLKQHIRTHTKEKPYQCHCCGKCFAQSCALKNHVNRVHDKRKPHACKLCQKCFTDKADLNKHMRTHTKERPHQCVTCHKTFQTLGNLSEHAKIHSSKRPFQCPQCPKNFIHKKGFLCHVRSHTGEKPYQCQYCSKYLSTSDFLRAHIRLHTNEKPYQCEHCQKCFTVKNSLLYHVRRKCTKIPGEVKSV